ncbi:MAG: type IV pilin [Candidatus Aenigmarchaeota archaeon]|nr:type IV pilin [Candidatus Aenigmarchaeota archaeon]
MKGVSPLIASVLLIAITMTLAAILASFVSSYTQQSLSELESCVGGTITFTTADYPQLSGSMIVAIIDVSSVDMSGFKIEAINSTGDVNTVTATGATSISAGSSGTIRADFSGTGVIVGNRVRVVAGNCPDVRTTWVNLK